MNHPKKEAPWGALAEAGGQPVGAKRTGSPSTHERGGPFHEYVFSRMDQIARQAI